MNRLSTGIPGLDEKIGGGLLPGSMCVLVGSSGIGKTQFGLQFLQRGLDEEGKRGFILDLTARGDSQKHSDYAKSLFNWDLRSEVLHTFDPASFFDDNRPLGDYLDVLSSQKKRVTRHDLDFDQWLDWKSTLVRQLDATIDFFFSHFTRGSRRFIIDGIEPVDHQGDSIQFELLEYVYHQLVQKEAEWVARDLFRQHFRTWESEIKKHLYPREELGCMVLYTSPDSLLDVMINRSLEEGDLFAGANTIIYMGKVRDGLKFRRAMYVFKHRGSVCPDEILFYDIGDNGLYLLPN